MALTKVIGAGLGTLTSDLTVAGNIQKTSGDLTVDVAGDVILDADGGDFIFKDGGSGDEINKVIRFSTPSHDTDEENVQILQVENEGSFNQISFGGGTSALNAATTLRFLTSSVDTTTGTERMRITSSGTIGIGDSTPTAFVDIAFDTQQAHTLQLRNTNSSAGGGKYIQFAKANGDFTGSITQSSDQNTVAFNTSSDYRLKENVSYDFDATSRLKQLKPARFNWISDENNTTIDGFIAHEVSGIVPEAITGEKDGTQDVGTIKDKDDNVLHTDVLEIAKQDGETWTKTGTKNVYQGIDQSKLVPLLTKALQEQQATIEALTARITALENA